MRDIGIILFCVAVVAVGWYVFVGFGAEEVEEVEAPGGVRPVCAGGEVGALGEGVGTAEPG